MQNYTELPGFEHVYLEDSWVLGIEEGTGSLRFRLDAVLTPGHPRYAAPAAGEQHCYVSAVLAFDGVAEIRWLSRSGEVAVDASGETDLGHVDSLVHDGDRFSIEGDWGAVEVHAAAPPGFRIL